MWLRPRLTVFKQTTTTPYALIQTCTTYPHARSAPTSTNAHYHTKSTQEDTIKTRRRHRQYLAVRHARSTSLLTNALRLACVRTRTSNTFSSSPTSRYTCTVDVPTRSGDQPFRDFGLQHFSRKRLHSQHIQVPTTHQHAHTQHTYPQHIHSTYTPATLSSHLLAHSDPLSLVS
ncbi:hypothetical protein CF319_g4849 [Tilletia indica]|nr:hypothetical protein CF319_g4849 [Tilletia indica]